MEFLIIVSSATLRDEIDQLFESNGITGFTCVPQATGSGKGGGTRLNDETWPGENSMYLLAITSDQAAAVKAWVREYRKSVVREGLKLFALGLKEVI